MSEMIPSQMPQSIRKRGAQPGNMNALKHGFYSRSFRAMEGIDLSCMSEGLVDEIALMRIMVRRVFEAANTENNDLEEWSGLLGTLGLATTRLAYLLKVQKVIAGGNGNDIAAALSEALKDINKDLA